MHPGIVDNPGTGVARVKVDGTEVRMTVVRREARRRWFAVLASVAVLATIPVAVSARTSGAPAVDPAALAAKIRASAGQPYQGYAESVGTLGLPELPKLGQVASLLSGNTRMRGWYASGKQWRVDVIGTGSERGVYYADGNVTTWDYGANRITFTEASAVGAVVTTIGGERELTVVDLPGEAPTRLPRGADLMPPDLARRLLNLGTGDRVTSIPGKRVAGIGAPGLRLTSADPHSTVGHIDIWADPRTGVPVEVAVTARNAERPILVTRFLEVRFAAPAADALVPPARRDGVSFTDVDPEDQTAIFGDTFIRPDQLAGMARKATEEPVGYVRQPGAGEVLQFTIRFHTGEVYGTGLTQLLVVALAREISRDALRIAGNWGSRQQVPGGQMALIAAPLLSVLVVRSERSRTTYLVVGLVDAEIMQRVGTELATAGR
jgi:hypothetical protein